MISEKELQAEYDILCQEISNQEKGKNGFNQEYYRHLATLAHVIGWVLCPEFYTEQYEEDHPLRNLKEMFKEGTVIRDINLQDFGVSSK